MKPQKSRKELQDQIFKNIFAIFAIFAIVTLVVITIYIFFTGIQPFLPNNKYGTINFFDFISGLEWNPSVGEYGILQMILATFFSTLLAAIIAVPVAILTAVAISEILPRRMATLVSNAVELLAGIPSIIYGIVGLAVIVPLVLKLNETGINPYTYGNSLLATAIVLSIMILPTIISVAVTALRAVPEHYREASYGLGATRIQTIFKTVIPAARSGIVAGIVLGLGRAVGETMAVVMVAGNSSSGFTLFPFENFIFQSIRPLTASIAVDIGYSTGLHRQVLFSTALVLFFFIFALNLTVQWVSKKGGAKK